MIMNTPEQREAADAVTLTAMELSSAAEMFMQRVGKARAAIGHCLDIGIKPEDVATLAHVPQLGATAAEAVYTALREEAARRSLEASLQEESARPQEIRIGRLPAGLPPTSA